MNKFSLRFNDQKLEELYQEYQTSNVRKPLLIRVCCVSILWNLMDFTQFLVQNKSEYMTTAIIENAYAPFILLQIFFLLIACFCKPQTTRWILLFQNHLFVFAYWMEQRLFTFEQAKFYTFLIIGTQFIILLTAECGEMIYQIIMFTLLYLLNMILENEPFTYSLIAGAIFSAGLFIFAFYSNSQKLRQHFKQHFLEDQWEQIFVKLTTGPFMIFDYNEQTYSFNFRNQNQFNDQIRNSQDLRAFLRSTTPKGKNEKNLEQFLHHILNDDYKQNVIGESLELMQENYIIRHHNYLTYSIFIGVNNIIIFQPKESLKKERASKNDQDILQSYQCKFKVLMAMAKKIVYDQRLKGQPNFNKFRRYFLFTSLYEQLKTFESPNQYLPSRPIIIYQLLNKIRGLYLDKNIKIEKNCRINKIFTSRTILAALIIGIIERIQSLDIGISYYEIENQQVEFIFLGYFNKDYFQFIHQKVKQFSIFTPNLHIDQFKIRLRVVNFEKYDQFILNSDEIQQISFRKIDTEGKLN